MNRRSMLIGSLAALSPALLGCDDHQDTKTPRFPTPTHDLLVAFILDTSGSFLDRMFSDKADAYRYFMDTVDDFSRQRVGCEDSILLTQISAERRTFLWEGSARDLMNDFQDADQLQRFFKDKSCPNGTRLYLGIADALDYIMEERGVKTGETEVVVIVLSDMIDAWEKPEESRARLVSSLRGFSKCHASLAFFWVDQLKFKEAKQLLLDAGIPEAEIKCGFGKPKLPNWQ
jgi:hypothetical protein